MANLWNIGDHENPVIQGQAGKPFTGHQQKDLYFSDSDIVYNNDCQCHYKYYKYYAFFSYIPLYKTIQKVFVQDWNVPDENGLISYKESDSEVYWWETLGDPVYVGCHPQGTFPTGVWLPFELPYNKYIKKDAPWLGAPQSQYICPWSLRVMYVNSMRCCNGEQGCGHQSTPQETQPLYCMRRYHVTALDTDQPMLFPMSKPICGIRKPHQNFEQLSGGSCQLTVWNGLSDFSDSQDPGTSCQRCIESLPQKALQRAAQRINRTCVLWRLYCKTSSYRRPDKDQPWQQITSPDSISDKNIWGLGDGWLHSTAHDTAPHVTCDSGVAHLYMWTSVSQQIAYKEPQWPYQSDNIEPCYSSCPPQEESQQDTDDQPPCNSPDAPPYRYFQFEHNKFTLWSRTYIRASALDSWEPETSQFTDQGTYTDWELQLDNWLDPVTRKFNGSAIQPQCGDLQVTRYYITNEGQPPCGVSYSDISEDCSQEPRLYQVYFTGKSRQSINQAYSQEYPQVTSFRTWKWYPLQKMSQQQMFLRGIVPGVWQKATQFNIADGINLSDVVAVYTSAACGDWPEVPKKKVFTWWRTVEPKFDSECVYTHAAYSQPQLLQQSVPWTKKVFTWDGIKTFKSQAFPDSLLQFSRDYFIPANFVGAAQYQYVCSLVIAQRTVVDTVFADQVGHYPVISPPQVSKDVPQGVFHRLAKNCVRSFYTVFYLTVSKDAIDSCSNRLYTIDSLWNSVQRAWIPTYTDPQDYTGIYYDKDKELKGVVQGWRSSNSVQDGFGQDLNSQVRYGGTFPSGYSVIYFIRIIITCGNQLIPPSEPAYKPQLIFRH